MAEVTRYSSEEMNSGNESNDAHLWTEQERQADFNRRKEELMKRKRRRKKRTSSSIQSSCFQGEFHLSTDRIENTWEVFREASFERIDDCRRSLFALITSTRTLLHNS